MTTKIEHKDALRMLRDAVKAGGGPTKFAKDKGVNRTTISLTLGGKRDMSPLLAETIGLRRIDGFERLP